MERALSSEAEGCAEGLKVPLNGREAILPPRPKGSNNEYT